MRGSARLFAEVKSAAKYLEANTPTGLTGLTTHPLPRPALIYTYRTTLHKLQQLPTSSVYRQSTEALTKHRLAIVEDTKPAGYDKWLATVKKQIEASPEGYDQYKNPDGSLSNMKLYEARSALWDGEVTRKDAQQEGSNTEPEAQRKAEVVQREIDIVDTADTQGDIPEVADLQEEPPLNADQINEIEVKIGAGLIEEVLQVAEGELTLVDEMLKSTVWEPLEEKPAAGQWVYFERGDVV